MALRPFPAVWETPLVVAPLGAVHQVPLRAVALQVGDCSAVVPQEVGLGVPLALGRSGLVLEQVLMPWQGRWGLLEHPSKGLERAQE